ncbi:phage holin family protein, partial [Undibacterium sp.]|uniref:phage holin family protein n=1 Tax=Undibacterium sp. TaxID=1914977 RepID=UPI002C2F51C1
ELARYATYLVVVLIAMFCAGIALLLGLLLIIALFWDSYRWQVLLLMIALFAGSALGLGLWLRRTLRSKPRLFAHTLAELGKDKSALQADNAATPPIAAKD